MLPDIRRGLGPHQPGRAESSAPPIAGRLRYCRSPAARAHGPSNSFRAAACACIAGVIRLLRRAASVRANTSKVWQSKRLRNAGFSPRRASRRRRAPFMKVSAKSLCPSPSTPSWTSSPGAAHEIVGLARARRALEEIERHGGANRKTCMAAVESAGMRTKSGVLAFAGSRSTAHKALSNCAARARHAALAMSVTAALSWVGA